MNGQGLHIYTHEFFPKRGGISTYCHEFAAAAQELGFSVTLHGPINSALVEHNYQLATESWAGNHNLPALYRARRLLRNKLVQNTESLHLLAEPASILAYGTLPKKIRSSAKVFITVHGSEIERWRRNRWAKPFIQSAFTTAVSISAVSRPIQKAAQDTFHKHASRIAAVPNALPSTFRKITPLRQASQSKDSLHILSVGRIHPRKGFDQVIQAIAQLPPSSKATIQYTIAGGAKDDNYLQALQQQAQNENVRLNIDLDVSTTDLQKHYQNADIFALTSVPYQQSVEGFGLVYLEAGAYHLPCLAYDIGGVRDAVIDGQTGYLIPPGAINTLALQIETLRKDPELRITLGQQNQAFALSRDWESVVKETLQL